jgi:hypothetical protein
MTRSIRCALSWPAPRAVAAKLSTAIASRASSGIACTSPIPATRIVRGAWPVPTCCAHAGANVTIRARTAGTIARVAPRIGARIMERLLGSV